jgi:hypothetical protein
MRTVDFPTAGRQKGFDMPKDQRRHRRFKTQGEVFAALLIPGEPIVMGKVLDVSSGGVGVQYLGTRRLEKGPVRMKMFRLNSSHMERAQSSVVYDLEMPGEPWIIPKVRRCGVKFEGNEADLYARLKELCDINQDCPDSKQSLPPTSLGV